MEKILHYFFLLSLVFLFTESYLIIFLRRLLIQGVTKISKKIANELAIFLACSMCIGFWVGFVFSFVQRDSHWFSLGYGALVSVGSYILKVFVERLEEKV